MSLENKAQSVFGNPLDEVLTLQVIPRPADTVREKFVEAGWFLSQMDLAGGKRAFNFVGGRTVTVGINSMSFRKPVYVGDLVSIYTKIIGQGRTSLVINIEGWAERLSKQERVKVTEGVFTFVATDNERRPIEITRRIENLPPYVAPPKVKSVDSPEPVAGSKLSIRTIPRPRDTNHLGDIFGGWILSEMEIACAKSAHQFTQCSVASVGVEAMTFHRPAFVGDEVTFYTNVVRVGHSSVTMQVETFVMRKDCPKHKVTEGLFTYVALDDQRRPVAIDRAR